MKKQRIISILSIVTALPGLGGILLLDQLSNFPSTAKIIVLNAIFLRGVCGVLGGALLWQGRKLGYYLTLILWLYLFVVSVLTINNLNYNGALFILEKPQLYSLLKISMAVPIIYVLLREMFKPDSAAL